MTTEEFTAGSEFIVRDVVTTPSRQDYDRFEALARRLVNVPKDEIERERDREKVQKA